MASRDLKYPQLTSWSCQGEEDRNCDERSSEAAGAGTSGGGKRGGDSGEERGGDWGGGRGGEEAASDHPAPA